MARLVGRDWNPAEGVGVIIPKVELEHRPRVTDIPIGSDEELLRISAERHLFLDPRDVPAIRGYYLRPDVRGRGGSSVYRPTDVEIEYIAQARSDHCNHNTFRGLFRYRDTGPARARRSTASSRPASRRRRWRSAKHKTGW